MNVTEAQIQKIIERNSYMDAIEKIDTAPPLPVPNLRTGVGHGHYRPLNRERPTKDSLAKKRRRDKASKASRRKNRGRR